MSERGAGRRFLFWDNLSTPAKGLAAVLFMVLLSAVAGGLLWGLMYRIAKAIGGWE